MHKGFAAGMGGGVGGEGGGGETSQTGGVEGGDGDEGNVSIMGGADQHCCSREHNINLPNAESEQHAALSTPTNFSFSHSK